VGGNAWERRSQALKFCYEAFPGPSEGLFQWVCTFCVTKRKTAWRLLLQARCSSSMQKPQLMIMIFMWRSDEWWWCVFTKFCSFLNLWTVYLYMVGGPVANMGAWQLNKKAHRLQQFLGPHIYTLTPDYNNICIMLYLCGYVQLFTIHFPTTWNVFCLG